MALCHGRVGAVGGDAGSPSPDDELDDEEDQQPAPVGPVAAARAASLRRRRLTFSADNRLALFLASPSKAMLDQARKDKKTTAEMPRAKLGLLELANGKRHGRGCPRVPGGRRRAGFLAYQKGILREAKDDGKSETPTFGKGGKKGTKGGKGGVRAATITPTFGSELIVRNLADNSERTFADVSDYQFTKDGKLLVL